MGHIHIVKPEVVYIQELKTRGCKVLVYPFNPYSWNVMRAKLNTSPRYLHSVLEVYKGGIPVAMSE